MTASNRLRVSAQRVVRGFYPGYFAAVMATGVLSIAFYQIASDELALVLFRAAQLAFLCCWIATACRAAWFLPELWRDFTHHASGPGFLTTVAATGVLGSEYVLLRGNPAAGMALWIVAAALWVVLMYGFLGAVIVGVTKPGLETGIGGGWLLPVVATQSLSLLAALLAHSVGKAGTMLVFGSLALLLLGWMLYVFIITLIFYRFTFVRLTAQEFTPEYWIDMGAEAITTMAGATLIMNAKQFPLLRELLPFLKGITILFWATGTWWIPLLAILALWRHVYRRVPLHYDPRYWGAVFPLAMYCASTFAFAEAVHLPFLFPLARVFTYIAAVAWLAVTAGLCASALRYVVDRPA